jgi:acyl-CoA thioesterase FadM
MHVCSVDLRPNDFDCAGHLNNSVHPQLMELGSWQWGIANGVDLRDGSLVAVVVSLHLDYLKPIEWNPVGRVMVRTDLVEVTAYSFTLTQDIECEDGMVFSRGRVRLALMDRASRPHQVDLDSLRTEGRSP